MYLMTVAWYYVLMYTHTCKTCHAEFKAVHPDRKFCNKACYMDYRLSHRQEYGAFSDREFWKRVNKTEACWLWIGSTRGQRGYGAWGKTYAHRYSYELAHGTIPYGAFVLHRCDVCACVNPAHLFVGSHGDNMADMHSKGRQASGDKNGSRKHMERMQRGTDRYNAKLDDEKVRRIRELYQKGVIQSELARMFGVNHVTMLRVIQRRTWKHVV